MDKIDILCQEYKDKNDTLNGLLMEYKADRDENIQLHEKLRNMEKLQEQIARLKQQSETAMATLQQQHETAMTTLLQQHKSELKLQALELKEKQQEKIEQLKDRHHEELEQATADYKTVLQELELLRKENYGLKEQLLKTPAPGKANTKKVRGNAKEEAEE